MSLFSVRKCNFWKKNVEKAQKSPWIHEVVSNTYPYFQSESLIIGKKHRKSSKVPRMQEAVSNTYPSFQSERVIIGKKRRKSSKVPMDALAGFQYISFFSVRKCKYTKQVEKTQKSPWIQEAVSNTYPFFHSENVIIQKKSKKLKSPHGCKRRFQIHVPLFSQKV